MAYLSDNPKTKKQAKEMLAEKGTLEWFQPGPFGHDVTDGKVSIEGPHFPEPHRWYATATIRDGKVVKLS